MPKKLKKIISILAFIAIAASLFFSKILTLAVFEGFSICTNILIPSMFVFLIISEFFYKINALNYVLTPFSFICEKLFKIDRKIGPILFFSLICGYPCGANLIANLVEEKKISKETAKRMLNFCVNAGPAFLISGISIPLSNSITFGLILFISQIFAFFVVGSLTSIGKKLEKIKISTKKEYTTCEALVSCVKNSIKNMAIICGFFLFFSAIINFLLNINIFNINSNFYFKSLFAGFLEVTNGVTMFKKINNINTFLIIALITSFGGLCVHFQIIAIISKIKISFKNFYIWRILYCLISLTTATILFTKTPTPILTFSQKISQNKILIHSPTISISLIILSIALLYCEKKIIIIKKNKKNRVNL